MDHRDWLARLPAQTKSALTLRSNRKGLAHLAGHLGAILVCGTLIALQVPLWWVLVPIQGLLLVFLFTLEHEATHQTPFAATWLNEATGRLCGLILCLPFLWFRYFHLAHHRWTNIPGKDPELQSPKPTTMGEWLWHVSGLPYWADSLRLLVRLAAGRAEDDFIPRQARGRIVAEARVMVLLYAGALAITMASSVLIWAWLVPMLVAQPALRLYLLAEHGDCPHVANMFENTRTTFTTRLVRFLAWNMPYHVEHHTAPMVPFHQLPQLHQLMKQELKVTAEGYAAFTRAYLDRRRNS